MAGAKRQQHTPAGATINQSIQEELFSALASLLAPRTYRPPTQLTTFHSSLRSSPLPALAPLAYGSVHIAKRLKDDERVALKKISKKYTDESSFKRETEVRQNEERRMVGAKRQQKHCTAFLHN